MVRSINPLYEWLVHFSSLRCLCSSEEEEKKTQQVMRRPSVIISHLDELLLAGAFLEIKTQDEKAAALLPYSNVEDLIAEAKS